MSLRDNIFHKLGYISKRDAARESKNAYNRGWQGAKVNRYNSDWLTTVSEINQEISTDSPALRARAEDFRKNNPIVAGIVRDNRVNVVGPHGFDYQPMAQYPDGTDDELANRILKENFEIWAQEEYCTLSKRVSFLTLQYLLEDRLWIDGAFIVRCHTAGEPVADNPFRFTLEPLDINDVDHNYTVELPNGNVVLFGYEFNKWRQLVNVYFKERTLYQEYLGTSPYIKRVPIPASELIIGFDPMHYKQVIGITPLAPVMTTMKDLDAWEFYSLQNAKASAAKMGFLQKSTDAMGEFRGSVDDDGNEEEADAVGGKYMDFAAGTVEELPPGYTYQGFDPKFPHEQHTPYVRATGRKITSGLGRDYSSTFGDREGESYSSTKTGELKMRGAYSYDQTILTEQFLKRVIKRWVKQALRSNILYPLSFALLTKYEKHYWQPYIRPWVDPQKEAEANKIYEEMGWKSKNEIITQNGGRLEDIFRDKQTLLSLIKKYGFEIESSQKSNNSPAANADQTNSGDQSNAPQRELKNFISKVS